MANTMTTVLWFDGDACSRSISVGGGLVVGAGLRYYPGREDLGLSVDAFYWLLAEEGAPEHVLTGAVGIVYEP